MKAFLLNLVGSVVIMSYKESRFDLRSLLLDISMVGENHKFKVFYKNGASSTKVKDINLPLFEKSVGNASYYVKPGTYKNYAYPFINAFYSYIYENMKVPGESLFINRYFEMAKACKSFNLTLPFPKNAITGRLTKTYPSLVRDFHAFLVCSDSGNFDRVEYNTIDDYNGTDLTVTQNTQSYRFALCMNSKNSLSELELKWTRRHPNTMRPDGFILLDNTESLSRDKIWLFPKQQIIDQIITTIEEK